MRLLLLVSLALTAGCTSFRAKMDDGRYPAKNALWVEVTQNYDGGSDTYNIFLASDKKGFCSTLETTYNDLAVIYDEFYDNYDDYDEYCDAQKALIDKYVVATKKLYKGGLSTVSIDFYDPDSSSDLPSEGTYTRTDDYDYYSEPEPTFYMSMSSTDFNLYEEYQRLYDCDDYDWYDELEEKLDEQDRRSATEGTLEVSKKGDSKYVISGTGKYEVDNGPASDGEFDIKGTFKKCEIELDGYAYLYF